MEAADSAHAWRCAGDELGPGRTATFPLQGGDGEMARGFIVNHGNGYYAFSDVHARVDGNLGWVTCAETILSHARGQISVTALLATNVFERRGGDWLVIHHHASHILAGEPPREASPAGGAPRPSTPTP